MVEKIDGAAGAAAGASPSEKVANEDDVDGVEVADADN